MGRFKHLRHDSGKDDGRTSVLQSKRILEVAGIRSYGRQRVKILGELKYSHSRAQMALSGREQPENEFQSDCFSFGPRTKLKTT